MSGPTELLLAGGFVFVCALFYLFAAMVSDPIIDAALAPLEQPDAPLCPCLECERGPATTDDPHTDPNSCRCPQCVAVIDLVRSLVDDLAWDDGFVRELEGGAA